MGSTSTLQRPNAAEKTAPLAGALSGDPIVALRPPTVISTLDIRLSAETMRTIHESVSSLELCSLVCKVVGHPCSARLLKDYIQGTLLSLLYRIVNVSPMGRGLFRVQFETADQASMILAQSPVDFHFAIGFFAKWSEGMDLTHLEGGLLVTVRFPGLLPEYAPHVEEIGRGMGFVIGDRVAPEGEDHTLSLRIVLFESVARNPPQLISLPTSSGRKVLQRVFFIGLPGHCFVCGRKGHLAAECTRRRVTQEVRQQAANNETLQAKQGSVDDGKVKPRTEAERARRREAKKKRRQVRSKEAPKLVYRRRNPPDLPSSSAHLTSPMGPIPYSDLDLCSSSEGMESDYERLFPSLQKATMVANGKAAMKPRRSSRLNSKS